LPAAYWLLPIAYCPLAVGCCLLPVACCLLPVAYCLLPIAYWLLPVACCPPEVACCLLPIACCLLPIAYWLFPVACCLLRRQKNLPPTVNQKHPGFGRFSPSPFERRFDFFRRCFKCRDFKLEYYILHETWRPDATRHPGSQSGRHEAQSGRKKKTAAYPTSNLGCNGLGCLLLCTEGAEVL
jgi:hypothetical protein